MSKGHGGNSKAFASLLVDEATRRDATRVESETVDRQHDKSHRRTTYTHVCLCGPVDDEPDGAVVLAVMELCDEADDADERTGVGSLRVSAWLVVQVDVGDGPFQASLVAAEGDEA